MHEFRRPFFLTFVSSISFSNRLLGLLLLSISFLGLLLFCLITVGFFFSYHPPSPSSSSFFSSSTSIVSLFTFRS